MSDREQLGIASRLKKGVPLLGDGDLKVFGEVKPYVNVVIRYNGDCNLTSGSEVYLDTRMGIYRAVIKKTIPNHTNPIFFSGEDTLHC